MKKVRKMKAIRTVLFALVLMACGPAWAATLMPPGKQQFFDANGEPLANGTVNFYVPNTTTAKNTWQDPSQTILNTNPVVLDSGGYALIYGSGTYRQVVKDQDGNLIWDQLTASTAEGSVETIQYYATSIGGAANAIVVSSITPSDYSLTTGKSLRFVSPLSNTGSTTLNPITLGTVTIKRAVNGNVYNLAGGELVSGGVYDVLYNGTDYILLNPSVVDNPCDLKPFAGATAPSGYVFTYGQAISRTTFAAAFACAGVTWGPGDGSTTFNLPDLRGRSVAGKDDMGGSAANRITNAVAGFVGTTLGAAGGDQNYQQHLHNVTVTDPGHTHIQNSHTHTITDPGHSHSLTATALADSGVSGQAGASAQVLGTSGPNSTNSATTGITGTNAATATNQTATTGITAITTNSGTGAAGNVQPTAIVNWIMRL